MMICISSGDVMLANTPWATVSPVGYRLDLEVGSVCLVDGDRNALGLAVGYGIDG